jgi:RNA polymerase sigma factor (sigma-70 family)
VVYRLVRNTEDTQDVVQNTWLKVHAQLGRFEARSEVRTWLTRIAVNCAIDYLRSSKRREAAFDPRRPRGTCHRRPRPTCRSRRRTPHAGRRDRGSRRSDDVVPDDH